MAFDFPASPTIGQVYNNYVWDGEKWTVSSSTYGAVRYDIDQGLTAAQQSQGRANIGVTKKNYIINGAMMISQENGATPSTAGAYYPVDMFTNAWSANGLTTQQVASPTPAGSPNRLRLTVTTPKTTIAASDYTTIFQCIEGLRFADLRWGSASAKTVTLAFGCKGPAGTYCIAFMNGATEARNYIAEYTITAGEANTDVRKSVTVPGDVAGTWAVDNTAAVRIRWTFLVGTTFQQAAGAWGTVVSAMGSANQFNLLATNGNVFELFDVSLTEGTVAPPFVVPDYASELLACLRYWRKNSPLTGHWQENSASQAQFSLQFDPPMRAAPTVVTLATVGRVSRPGIGSYNIGVIGVSQQNTVGMYLDVNTALAVANVSSVLIADTLAFNARL
jgi:hypothetical protein